MALAPDIKAAWTKTPTSLKFHLILWVYHLAFGLCLVLGDPRRFAYSSFAAIRQYGGVTAWGVAFIVLAFAIGFTSLIGCRPLAASLAVSAVAHLLLAAGFIAAVVTSPDAALTGPVSYSFVAASVGGHAVHYMRAYETWRGTVGADRSRS